MPIRQEFWLESDGITREVEAHGSVGRTKLRTVIKADSDIAAHRWWANVLCGENPRSAEIAKDIRTVDLFASVGGLSLGFGFAAQALGMRHHPLLAVDIDDGALSVYERNFPEATILSESVANLADIGISGQSENAEFEYPPEIINDDLGCFVGDVDVVLAGPPCQGHSTLNNRTRHEDSRNHLYLETVGTAVALQAPLIIIENVPTVRNDRNRVVETAKSLLASAGYELDDRVISGAAVGAPQSRRRHFLIASRSGIPSIRDAIRGLAAPPMTLRQAIGDLVDVHESFLDAPPQLSEDNYRRIDYLFSTGQYDLPNEQRPDCHRYGHTYPSVYGRLHWDEPSPTITTGYMTPGRGRFIHPGRQRTLTAHEAARIQGFPDSFDFALPDQVIPSRKQLAKWIGDAVPSQIGYVAGICGLATLALDQRDENVCAPSGIQLEMLDII